MSRTSPAPISAVINQLASRHRWHKRFSRSVIWKSWPEISGEAMARHAWPMKFRESDMLVIAVSDNVWMQQLSLQKLSILNAINRLLPIEGQVRDIRFEIGNIDEVRKSHISSSLRKARHSTAHDGKVCKPACEDAGQEIKEHAEALTEPVKDRELKDMLQQIYIKSRLKKRGGEHATITSEDWTAP